MSAGEKELREILKSFAKQPPDFEVFVLKLLDIKAWHQEDMARTRQVVEPDLKPRPRTDAKNTILALCELLGEAAKLSRQLNAGTMPKTRLPKARVNSTKSEIRVCRMSGNHSPFSIEGRNIATDLTAEILDWLKAETEKATEQLVMGQKTIKRVDEFDLWMLAITCESAGIKCSYSSDTPFHRLAEWLLGEGSHRRIIEKIIKQHSYLKDEKNKIPEI